jgi:hypothetical protein
MALKPPQVKPLKKVRTKAVSKTPASSTERGTKIPKTDKRAFQQSVSTLRSQGNSDAAIRYLAKIDGVFSAAVHNMVQTANSGWSACFRDVDGNFSSEGTVALYSLIARMNTVYDYTKGFTNRRGIDSLLETLLRDAATTGGVGGELVLNEQRWPDRIQTISLSDVTFVSRGDGTFYPVQETDDGDVKLDLPTIWFEFSHLDSNDVYPTSIFESALGQTFYFDEFVEDVRRSVRESGHSRLVVELDAEKVAATAPADVRADPEELRKYMDSVRSSTEDIISNLSPEDALVYYNTAKPDILDSGLGNKVDYVPLMKTINGLLSTALKTPPSILGLRLEGSQSLSNTESLIFLKTAKSLQTPVETLMRRALTLAMRLIGFDGYAEFFFKPIHLRPELELEAFTTMRQNRILHQLSLGHITDDEAAWLLGTFPRPEGAPDLSGTMFMDANQVQNPTPNADPMGRAMQSDQPTSAGGADNASR